MRPLLLCISSFVREDFAECCAYCLLHEILAAGQENLAEEHGGGLTARNRQEGGLEVVVTLPV